MEERTVSAMLQVGMSSVNVAKKSSGALLCFAAAVKRKADKAVNPEWPSDKDPHTKRGLGVMSHILSSFKLYRINYPWSLVRVPQTYSILSELMILFIYSFMIDVENHRILNKWHLWSL